MKIQIIVYFCFLTALTSYSQVVERVEYSGNVKTKTKILEKLTSLEVGQSLDSIVLSNDATLFSRLPVCNKASFEVKELHNKNYVVTYLIEETNTIIPSVKFWTANKQQFVYQLGITEFNFLGENKEIGGFYRNNGYHSFALSYKDPFLFNKTTGASITLQSLTSLEPLYFKNGSANYKYTNSSVETLLFKRLTQKQRIDFGINFFQEKYNYVDGDKPVEVPEKLEEYKLLFKAGFDYNNLTYNYQYVDGFRWFLNGQYVMPLEDHQQDFLIFTNDFYYYKKIREKGPWASRLKIGLASNDDTPFAPFALDNNLNIRGVGNIIDRGTALMVLNTEYRYTILDEKWFTVQSNIFIDVGNWRTAGGELKELIHSDELRLHSGLGLRFIHKKIYNAVLRIDYGRSIIKGQREKGWVFGIGQYF